MKYLSLIFSLIVVAYSAQSKSWRVNNNAGVNADFTTFHEAANSTAVLTGDTIYLEPSDIDYVTNSITLTKRLVILGVGYFLDPSDTNYPPNTGLQVSTEKSGLGFLRIGNGANGSVFAGLTFASGIYIQRAATALNITIERNRFNGNITFENGNSDDIKIRKNFFNNAAVAQNGGATISNFVFENNIMYSTWSNLNLTALTGSGNLIRNNSFYGVGAGGTVVNAYIANNIFGTPAITFTDCTLKNNVFATNQILPGTATNNKVSIDMNSVYTGGNGSIDSRVQLKSGSPASAAGLTVGAVTNPDCGAFGATDPYKLSGIPNIPSIYSLTVPTSIPSGSATMNVTFSTRNNN